MEKLLRGKMTRGSVTVHLHARRIGAAAAYPLNVDAIGQYIAQLRNAAGEQGDVTIDLAALAMLPGACVPPELSDAEREAAWTWMAPLIDEALDKLIAMRREEGRGLADDLLRQCEVVQRELEAIHAHVPTVVQEYQKRLHARVEELIRDRGVTLAEKDLIREVGIFAERSDVNEELSRLSSHVEQFHECLKSKEPTGRKLDFIAQEMLREANTIGSKAGDAQIARHIIEIKGAIDRIKEQVQNAE